MSSEELYFSLDIGTRTIVGIVGTLIDMKYKILAFEVAEHRKRSMFDGQIHDIESVVKVVLDIKKRLEDKFDTKFNKVSIAAAGRSLKTTRFKVERELNDLDYVDKDIINSMEIEAVQKAQKELENRTDDEAEFYCAGYAVANYFLNGTMITNLEGHRGNNIAVEIIATFLPKVVVDSLYFVIDMAGLSVDSMTLEPIAALNVSVQDNFKLLNIALVDIGAGTSDIALTKDGSIFSFAMVPMAGDEITEKISHEYLLDFNTAEKVKIGLSNKGIIDFEDIMGNKLQVDASEILERIESTIKKLAKEISSKILKYNGKAPSAVFLIGGGSCIPHVANFISEYLELPKERVGVRKTDIIKDIEFDSTKMEGPEYITPIGIAVSSNSTKKSDFLTVTVNNKAIRLLNTSRVTIADILIHISFNPRNLIGHRGNSLFYTLNGKEKVIKGKLGEAATIYINNIKANLESNINNGDIINIIPSTHGEDAHYTIGELKGDLPFIDINVYGENKVIYPSIFVNGNLAKDTYNIHNGDSIVYILPDTISKIIQGLSITADNRNILLNGKRCNLEDKVCEEDIIELINIDNGSKFINEELSSKYKTIKIWVNDIQIKMSDKKDYIFVDIFNYIDIDTKNKKGNLILRINDMPADYTDVLNDGDRIEIRWV